MAAEGKTTYDDVPYTSLPFAQTHPDRLAALARLFGVEAPPLERCRVLELGCASGGNLIPMALTLPGAEFVGIDLSSVQINDGLAVVAALGLGNVRLSATSITEIDSASGPFDYVILSEVLEHLKIPPVRALRAVAAMLRPGGRLLLTREGREQTNERQTERVRGRWQVGRPCWARP